MQRGAFDASDFAAGDLEHFGIKTLSFGPAQIHSQDHFGPVLRLSAARASLNLEKRVVRVHRTGEHASKLERFETCRANGEVTLSLFKQFSVVFFTGQCQQVCDIPQTALQTVYGFHHGL